MLLVQKARYWALLVGCLLSVVTLAQDSTTLQATDIPPLFEGCDDPLISPEQRQACSAPKLQAFVQAHLQYPDSARTRGIEGVVVVRFKVSEDGNITGLELLRNIGAGCGQEALRVVRSMPAFSPALRNGVPIATTMTLPIRFKRPVSTTSTSDAATYHLEWGAAYHQDIAKKQLQELTRRFLVVRDVYGEEYEIQRIEMTIQTPSKTIDLETQGGFFDIAMRKALKRLRPHHRLTWTAIIEHQHQPIEVTKTWLIIP